MYIQLLESSYFYLHVIINKIWVYSIINLEKKPDLEITTNYVV